jgi:signal transduction histidine kinase/ligand-binding sensor domain-containing protein/DNA-binding NarL/FixJ family response regulator
MIFAPRRLALIVAGCLAWSTQPATAGLDPDRRLTQFTRTVWEASAGLPQASVQAILQTGDGYVWMGTEEGLVRFDGERFVVFDRRNTPALPGQDVKSLFEGPDGTLWIGMVGGLARMQNGHFQGYSIANGLPHDWIVAVTGDRAGNIWIGTSGGGLLRFANGRTTAFTTSNGLPDNFVWTITESRDGSIWVGTSNGLARMTGDRLTTYSTKDGLPDARVSALLEDRDGSLWIGTAKGLARNRDGTFQTFTTLDGLSNDDVSALYQDVEGSLWIGGNEGVARRTDRGFDRLSVKDGLNHNSVASLTGDREGNIWVGTNGGGVTKLTARSFSTLGAAEGLASNVARTIVEGRDGAIWIGTQSGGLNRLKDGRVVSSYTKDDGLPGDTVTALLERADGSLWIGTGAGLARLQNGHISNIRLDRFQGKSIRALFEEPDGTVWIGTTGRGLAILKAHRVTVWDAGSGLSDVVRSFYKDPNGTMWVGSDAGLSRYVKGSFETFGPAQGVLRKPVMTLGGDADGTIWAGTLGDGLYRYKDGSFTHYSTSNGLPDNAVFQIVDDRQGSLWMTSNQGVFRVSKSLLRDVAERRISAVTAASFGGADGMRSAECNGNAQPAGIRARDGSLWFPTIKGVSTVRPDKLIRNALPPAVVIEHVLADRRPVASTGDVRVPPGRGELEFRYTALSFVVPDGVRFKYRLQGFDQEWVDAGRRREAHYTNLPAGSYQFQVVAQNNDGVWNPQGASVGIRLEPHFYETLLFDAAAVVAFMLAIGGFLRLRVRRMRQKAAALEQIVEDRTHALREEVGERRRAEEALRQAKDDAELASRAKGQFLANMSHEIRTPMNGIIGMTTLARATPLTPEQREYLDMVQHSADALLNIINDILDFSKIESGKLDLDLTPFALRRTVRETLSPLALRARDKGIQFAVDIAPSVPDALVGDHGRLGQILINLVSNAIKFTRAGGVTVTVGAERMPDDDLVTVHFAVADTGIGIPADKQALIFEPFRQADGSTTREFGGTGLGLAICRTLVEIFGGRIWVESAGPGSTFHFTAPLTVAAAAAVSAPSARDIAPQPRRRLHVLLAEDNHVNQLVARRLLERLGHSVVIAETGLEAVEAHAHQTFDVILMDVQMPEMNGFEATAAIRAAEGTPSGTPIVAMTAHAMKGDRERCLAEGMDDYLSKPIDSVVMAEVIERVLRHAPAALQRPSPAHHASFARHDGDPVAALTRVH